MKHAIIIGVGPGVSHALVKKFGREGYKVSMLSRNKDRLLEYKKQLKDEGIDTEVYQTDASNFASLQESIHHAIEQHGTPEVFIYHAAALHGGKIMEHLPLEFVNDFKVNVAGAIQAAQTAVPYMDQLDKSTFILTGGGFAQYPSYEYASISIGKAGILSVAKMLGQELANTSIKVATVTINGMVSKGSAFDPDKIAETYWEVHMAPQSKDWNVEVPFNGK